MANQNLDMQFSVVDNTSLVMAATDEQIIKALIAIGAKVETHAKADYVPVDTGRLKNSITFALAGRTAMIATYNPDITRYKTKTGKTAIRTRRLKTYSYKGKAPADPGGKPRSVYVGSNVEYAEIVENGTSGRAGKHYLRNAVVNHMEEYKNLAERALKGQG